MLTKVALIVVIVAALVLGVLYVQTDRAAKTDHEQATNQIAMLSNGWSKTSMDLEEMTGKAQAQSVELSNKTVAITMLSNTISDRDQTIKDREAALKASQDEVASDTKKIAELQEDNKQLDAQTVALTNQINAKSDEIVAIQKKLDSSEGDKVFLEKELQRLMAEKAELERKFNDLAVLKDQVHKLQDELDVSRRLEWIRQGLYASQEQKGAQRLMQGGIAANTRPVLTTNNYDLNVEVKSDGSVKVIEPIQATPAPGDSTTPPK